MLKVNELKVSDLVMAEYDGQLKEGEVINVDTVDHKALIVTEDDQEFWYDEKHITPIMLDEKQLIKLGFAKQSNDDGTVKYMKGAFRVLLHHADDFSTFEMWYREDTRLIRQSIFVHDFQNKYYEMVKIHLSKGELI